MEKVLNKEVTSKINISDADITTYYNQHKAEFNLIEPQYHLAQILVTTQPNPQVRNLKNDKAQNEAEARKKIQMIAQPPGERRGLCHRGHELQRAAGDLGQRRRPGLRPRDLAARGTSRPSTRSPSSSRASTLSRLAVADPNSHQVFGYRIVKLIARKPAGQRELKDPRVQQAIREQLRDRREQLLRAAYYDSMHNGASIENYFADQILKSADGQ